MVVNVYSLFDRLEGAHRTLVTSRSDASAVRTFCEEMVRYRDSLVSKNVSVDLQDYELHKLGTFDDESGVLTSLSHYEVLPLNYGSADSTPSAS